MGTETPVYGDTYDESNSLVKLNNPLMGTETTRLMMPSTELIASC